MGDADDKLESARARRKTIPLGEVVEEDLPEEEGTHVYTYGPRKRLPRGRDTVPIEDFSFVGSFPASIAFSLLGIRTSKPCFICEEGGCELIFSVKSTKRGKTKTYAVHAECVFDHRALEAVGSRGR